MGGFFDQGVGIHSLPSESALFLSGYGTRITPAYHGNWIKKLL